eukprot:9343339-Alexandrium_andersonii.AAC.1
MIRGRSAGPRSAASAPPVASCDDRKAQLVKRALRDARGAAMRNCEPILRSITQLVFVEVFSGCGALSKAFAALGYQVVARD